MSKASPAQVAASIRYNKEKTTQFKMSLNNKTDADIIEHLKTRDNKQGYVKQLIRNDMKGGETK